MFLKKIIPTFCLVLSFSICPSESKVYEYKIDSIDHISPDRFKTLTGHEINETTIVGYDIDGTLTKMPKAFKKFRHGLIAHWKDEGYTREKYNRVFSSLEEAVQFYNDEVQALETKLNMSARAFVFEPSTALVMDRINQTGATSLCVTLRDGNFETFDQESSVYHLHVNAHNKFSHLENDVTHNIAIDKNSEKKRIGSEKVQKLHQMDVNVSYRNGVVYTGWRRAKGLALKSFLQLHNIMPHYADLSSESWKYKDLIFIDNENKNFKEIARTLKPYFKNIYFFHLSPQRNVNFQS